jgi:CheY-like chemotaxis protein
MTQNKRRILVVDDEESIRRVLRASLIGPNADPLYQVYDAENGNLSEIVRSYTWFDNDEVTEDAAITLQMGYESI